MRTLLTTLFAAIMIAVVGIPTGAEAARVDTLIKGSGPTIYWAAQDGKKYTFPNIATYYTWFTSNDFRLVKKISEKELKAIPTAGNVTYRGGAKLVKFPNESTVYAVSRYSVLRPILNPQVATQLYGAEWTRLIETIPWTLRGDYRIGSTIRAAYEYSASIEYNGVKTPSDNIGTPNFNPLPPVYILPFYPYTMVDLTLSSNSVQKQDQVTAYAKASDIYNSRPVTLEIYVDGTRIGSCQNTNTCALTFNNPTANVTREVYARAFDGYGAVRESDRQTVYVSDHVDAWTQGSFWADRRLDAEWVGSQTLRLTGRITQSNRETQNLRLTIIDTSTNQNVKHCVGTDYCTVDVFMGEQWMLFNHAQWVNTSRYALLAFDMNGQELGYVYAPTIPGNNAYTPTVTTNLSLVSHDRAATFVDVVGSVSGASHFSNTRIEIYTTHTSHFGYGTNTSLVHTCFDTSTCAIRHQTNTVYGSTTYHTRFIDANGNATNSPTHSL